MEYTFEQFINDVYPHPQEAQEKGIRQGQRMSDILYSRKPELIDEAERENVDPFFDDSKIDDFLTFVATNWDKA